MAAQFTLCTLAAFARFDFRGKGVIFALVPMQLLLMPDNASIKVHKRELAKIERDLEKTHQAKVDDTQILYSGFDAENAGDQKIWINSE
ncbi:MAG: hypothetical protein N4A61_03730 [Pelagimonas sp.]|jgi:hypothetical protein|nr:hypothetical protein [Pelagimonas sp.]